MINLKPKVYNQVLRRFYNVRYIQVLGRVQDEVDIQVRYQVQYQVLIQVYHKIYKILNKK